MDPATTGEPEDTGPNAGGRRRAVALLIAATIAVTLGLYYGSKGNPPPDENAPPRFMFQAKPRPLPAIAFHDGA
jgi:hypothetical protein